VKDKGEVVLTIKNWLCFSIYQLKKCGRIGFAIFLAFSLAISAIPAMASDSNANSTKPSILLDFTPSDAIMDPTQPVIYLTDGTHNRVVAVNYWNGTQTTLSFSLKPEHLTFANGELYVTLLRSGHLWSTDTPMTGAVAIVNPQTLSLTDQIEIQTDPYSIAVNKEGFIYITPGSNQWSPMLVYYRYGKEQISKSSEMFEAWSLAMLQPGTDKLYTTSTASFPPDTVNPKTYHPEDMIKTLGVYRLVSNQIQQEQNYLAVDDHISTPMRFSPDGQFLFNGSGEVLDQYFHYVTFISPFSDIAFDPVSRDFYTSSKTDNAIQEYTFNNQNSEGLDRLQPLESYQSSGQVAYLFYQASQLIAVSKNSVGEFLVETIPVPARKAYTSNSYQKQIIPLNFIPTQTILDPKNPVLFMTDAANNKVYAVNYLSQEIKSVQLDFSPERMAYENGELYVTLRKAGNIQYLPEVPGSIQILKADTLHPVDRIDLEFAPSDLVVKGDNLIVIPTTNSNARIRCYSLQTKQIISTGSGILGSNFAQLGPTLPRVYTVSTDPNITPHDMHYFSLENGKLGDPKTWPNLFYSKHDTDKNFRISPDGKLVFNGSGEVFDQDLNHVASLDHTFNDFSFSPDSKRIYAADHEGPLLHIYEEKDGHNVFTEIGALTTLGQPEATFLRDDQLIAVSTNEHREVMTNPSWIEFFFLQHDPNDGVLSVRNVFPDEGSKASSINLPLVLSFSDQVFIGDPKNILLKDANGQIVKTISSLEAINNLLLVKFDQDLQYDSSYTVTIPRSAGVDSNGQGFSPLAYLLNFKTGQEFNRLSGQDRYDTAVKISQEGWQKANNVVLATGNNFPDALSAAPLARKMDAPILLTTPNQLPAQIEGELDRLHVQRVFIVGGYAVVSSAIEEKLHAKGIETVRLSGIDCYATSVAIANYLGPVSQIFIVSGDSFPDALSIASYAAQKQIPILLTTHDSLPAVVKDYMTHNRITKTYIIGGEAVISADIGNNLICPSERIAGRDRYETNLAVFQKFVFDYSETFVATGESFPDALAGSALAGANGNPILLVSSNTSQKIIDILRENKGIMKMKYILGGEAVVPKSLVTKVFGQ